MEFSCAGAGCCVWVLWFDVVLWSSDPRSDWVPNVVIVLGEFVKVVWMFGEGGSLRWRIAWIWR